MPALKPTSPSRSRFGEARLGFSRAQAGGSDLSGLAKVVEKAQGIFSTL
jgi:hypothetical protein